MNTFRVRLTLRSPLGTPLVADTLFGHLCWGIAYHKGPQAVTDFLAGMSGPEPPLVISDPLCADHWPTPALPGLPPDAEDKLLAQLEQTRGSPLAAHDHLRELFRRPWLPHEIWSDVSGQLDFAAIIRALLQKDPAPPASLAFATVAHNTINRLSGQTLEEGGFFFDRQEFPTDGSAYDVWVRTSFDADRVSQLFEWGLAGGYGRDGSTGKGRLTVEAVEPLVLPSVDGPNAVMTLGTCAPAAADPADGCWNLDVRHGKLGGPLALHAGEDDQTPVFKKPVVLLARGAIVMTSQPRPIVGRIVKDVHPTRPEVVTCGLTLTLPVRLTEEAFPCPLTA
jgi:CRISPR-associated protein Csm4